MPPENPGKFENIRKSAVSEAEARTASLKEHIQGKIPEVIDSTVEVKAFFDTAYALLNKYIDDTNDPALLGKKQELEAIYREQKANEKEYYYDEEKTADEYWESLLAIMEKEERQAIKHGPDLLKTLGIADSCKITRYTKYESKERGGDIHSYNLEKDHFKYYLRFMPDGKIEISFPVLGETSKYLNVYRSEKTAYDRDRREIKERNVSLSELKDLSAFTTYLSPLDFELSHIIEGIQRTLDYLPKRSTDPELMPFIEFRDELSSLFNEIFSKKESQDWKLTSEQYAYYMEKIGEFLRKRLRQYFETPDKINSETARLRWTLENIVRQYPHFIDAALEEAKTLEELQLFNFDKEYENYLYAKTECKRDKLSGTNTTEITKELAKYKLSPQHKETLLYLNARGFIQKPDFQKFIPLLKSVHHGVLEKYKEFITDYPDWFSSKEPLIVFTAFAKGLSANQFGPYTRYWMEHKAFCDEYELKDLNNILRAQKTYYDLELAYVLFTRDQNPNQTRKLMARMKKIAQKKKIRIETVQYYVREFTAWPPDLMLTALETLDAQYTNMESNAYLKLLVGSVSPYGIKPVHFKKLNSLKEFQKKGLDYIKSGLYFSTDDFTEFLDTLIQIQSEPEMEYALLTAPRRRIDEEAIKKGEHPFFAIIGRPSAEGFSKAATETAKHKQIWGKMAETQESTGKKFSKISYEIIIFLIEKKFDDATIVRLLPKLIEVKTDIQKETIVLLITMENAEELINAMALCAEECLNINYGFYSSVTQTYYKALSQKPPINGLLKLIHRLAEIQNNEHSLTKRNGILLTMAEKTKDYEELLTAIERIENPEFIAEFEKLCGAKELQGIDVDNVSVIYFRLAVSPSDLNDFRKVMDGLKNFLMKASHEKYSPETDPDYNRAMALLDAKGFLEKEDTGFTHMAFILNMLQNSSQEFNKAKLTETALKFLDDPKEIFQEKGAKLLIGLGTTTQTLDQNTIVKIAQKGVDGKLTQFTLSDKITIEQLAYLGRPASPQVPLSLYFSFLISMEQAGKSKDQAAFETLVKRYKNIEQENVYRGKVLALSHNPNDETHSYLFAQDSFNTESHTVFAKEVQGLKVETLRHGEKNESVESMFSKLETTRGDLTLIIGGHGGENYISFGEEGFHMDQLFDRLKIRIKQQKEGKKWTTTIIFHSCHSDYNIALLNKLWAEDPETKDFPTKMLSSSNENMPSEKMTRDSWAIKARETKSTGKPLTWGEFYRDIESRNFLMSYNETNSNQTLFIDGEELGVLETSKGADQKTA